MVNCQLIELKQETSYKVGVNDTEIGQKLPKI